MSAKRPGDDDKTKTETKYPRIESVFAQEIVFNYGEPINLSNFSVFYQMSVEDDPEELAPSTGEGGGFLINGSALQPKAGIYKEGEDGKYGEFKLVFTSEDDPTAKSFEFPIFVVATQLDATYNPYTDLRKLEIVRMPTRTIYDKDEPFLAHGLVVVAWYGDETAGATIKQGGVPLQVPQPVIDSTALLEVKNGEAASIKIKYTDGNNKTAETTFPVYLQIAEHEIQAPSITGVTFSVPSTARTGAMVTLGVKVDSDFELKENGILLDMYNKDNEYISGYTGMLNEIAPESFTRRVAFVMPRNNLKISAETLQVGSGLGTFNYQIGEGDIKPVPGFAAESHLLSYQLAIPSTVAEEGSALTIQAGPLAERPSTSITTVQIIKTGATESLVQKTYTGNTDNSLIETPLGVLTAGANHDYEIQVSYQLSAAEEGSVRTYKLQVMKFASEVNTSITYEYTGNYQIFEAPLAGYYRIEAWGGRGGNANPLNSAFGGKGGYVAGTIYLDPGSSNASEKMPLYIYVGEAGKDLDPNRPYLPSAGGWNGGGNGGESAAYGGAGGGGATSISTVAGEWSSLAVLGNRILVAGGGGGAGSGERGANKSNLVAPVKLGNIGGGIAGSPSITHDNRKYGAYTSFTASEPWTLPPTYNYKPGQAQPPNNDPTFGFNGQGFGRGGTGLYGYQPNPTRGDGYNGKGGGGGGWWGGRVSPYMGSDEFGTNAAAGGGGGSNFIAGHADCQAVLNIVTTLDFTTGKNSITVYPASDSIYRSSAGPGGKPVAGESPALEAILFTDTVMNAYEQSAGENKYEPIANDLNLNNSHGKVTITYYGTTGPVIEGE